jgi:tRNA threonylcarbamoyladenosine biosynthesis protein TsaE
MAMSESPQLCIIIHTCNETETRDLARRLAADLAGGEVIGLSGDLGAGKTVFVQGLADGLGAAEPVTSPSFTLVHEHAARFRLYHIDLYRLGPDQIEEIGIEELIAAEAVIAIEWSERMSARLRRRLDLEIAIEFGAGESERCLRLTGAGPAGARLVRGIAEAVAASGDDAQQRGETP